MIRGFIYALKVIRLVWYVYKTKQTRIPTYMQKNNINRNSHQGVKSGEMGSQVIETMKVVTSCEVWYLTYSYIP